MPDPITFAGWLAAVAVFVVQEIRRVSGNRQAPAGMNVDELRAMIREELDPIKDLADKNDHDNATNRKEIGYATAEIKHYIRKMDEHRGEVESKLARLGEAVDARVAKVELRLEGVIIDQERSE